MHDDDEPCFAEEMLDTLIPTLIRGGVIPAGMLLGLAEQLDHEAQTASVQRTERIEEMTSALRTWALEAVGATRSDFHAEQRRKGFRVIELPDKA